MSMFKKMSDTAAVKTHGVVDGSLIDLINPMSLPGDTTTAVAKTAVSVLFGYVGRGYKENKTFSL